MTRWLLLTAALLAASHARATNGTAGVAPMDVASSVPTGVVSFGNTLGKTEVHKTFTKNTAAAGVSVLGTYTVTAGKTLYVTHMDFTARTAAISASAANLGNVQLATPSGTSVSSMTFVNPTTSQPTVWSRDYAEPWSVPSAAVFMSSVSAAVATSTDWIWNFDGYEK